MHVELPTVPLLERGEDGYDAERELWNRAMDRRPELIALPRDAGEAASAVLLGRRRQLPIAVRGGGHSVAGYSCVDDGLMISLARMNGIDVDPATRRVRAGGGTLLGQFDRATAQHGLAVPSGHVSHTGLGGLTLGGGIGWLMRKWGLSIDHLVGAEVVTADGEVLWASETDNVDLFWGLRGAGPNFGIVTQFEFEALPLGKTLLSGSLMFEWSKAREALAASRDVMAAAPDELTIYEALFTAPARAPFTPEQHGQLMLAVGIAYTGPVSEGERLIEPLRRLGPVLDLVGDLPYASLQSMNDPTAPWGLRQYSRAHWQTGMPDEAIEALASCWEQVSSPLARVVCARMGGAIERVPDTATAFANRTANRLIWISSMWADSAEDATHKQWCAKMYDAMEPWSTGSGYINAASDEPAERIQATFGPNWKRLVALKDRYDPENVFRRNQNIPPSKDLASTP